MKFLFLFLLFGAVRSSQRPNIVVIVADDLVRTFKKQYIYLCSHHLCCAE